MDVAPVALGALRGASGVPFLLQSGNAKLAAEVRPSLAVSRLQRSVGYRDALIGVGMIAAAVRGKDTRGWFLAAAGAHAVDLLDGLVVDDQEPLKPQVTALTGAVLGLALGCWGVLRRQPA